MTEAQKLAEGDPEAGHDTDALITPSGFGLNSQQKTMPSDNEVTQYGRAQLEAAMAKAQPRLQEYLTILRPWRTFFKDFRTLEVTKSDAHLRSHLENTFAYYQANYLVLSLVVLTLFILNHPSTLISILMVIACWVLYMYRGGLDPSWKPACAGIEITSWHRLVLMSVASLNFLFLVDGVALFILAGVSAGLAVVHATFHKGAIAQEL